MPLFSVFQKRIEELCFNEDECLKSKIYSCRILQNCSTINDVGKGLRKRYGRVDAAWTTSTLVLVEGHGRQTIKVKLVHLDLYTVTAEISSMVNGVKVQTKTVEVYYIFIIYLYYYIYIYYKGLKLPQICNLFATNM